MSSPAPTISSIVAPAEIPLPSQKSLAGPKVLLMGPAGTGKTYSLGTLADWAVAHQKQMGVIFIEQGADAFAGYWTDRGLSVPPGVYWHTVDAPPLMLADLMKGSKDAASMSYEILSKMVDPNRAQRNAYYKILEALSAFKDDRSGKLLGAVDKWETDWVLGIDGLSEMANAAMKMVIGNKPTASQPDYMVAQNNLMNLLRLLTQGVRCTLALTAHVDRETDVITGGTKIMVSAIGKAISPNIPALFSDVIYTVREGDKFYWDTAAFGVDTKTRSLGYRSKIDPNFGQIMDLWLKRGGK